LKPDIVFFGESLGEGFERAIQRDLPRCDLLVVIGSSMRVQVRQGSRRCGVGDAAAATVFHGQLNRQTA
jgi:NAD-dependent SIR2 family protein deacetylase